ncbi:hypothetical protein BWQ96_05332 [Gracilariopsis chorda]|uniref:Uncharacterized protein n=1 Tax=Gracilariopsis chorda TaxID=448386 RepID=A0A2V3IS23_9FLOR|nr:hypothetical protein BWQ96_05332 [Gracilariopsis chorda]|eukprot:PXF44912.1 hypothetical protein BWQ96_05332 [Gracilariopsis chorda]
MSQLMASMPIRSTPTGLHQGGPIWHGTLRFHGSRQAFQTEAMAVPTTSAPRPDWGKVLELHGMESRPIEQFRREILASRFCFRLVPVNERGVPHEEHRVEAIAAVMEEGAVTFRVRVADGWIFVWGIHDERGNSSLLGGFFADGTPLSS